ncbi:ABZJ_00895 family protein [Rhizobium wuzhouense]|uniref:Uncharacterized protein n=1 Tax=Rhizobium wuzhouense TaxID=1986026 RepID=A0ABX5NUZ6_9HYPH|nr:ABZJ_00895 family protein [Rhizobium wuzhouense]PYB76997.1 hypothetical protein DMY87_00985 [Rhizobium wuzhouense]
MPSFIVPMAIRYVLVSLAITVVITAVVTGLMTFGYMSDKPSSLSHLVVMGAGMWAGVYFAKQAGRPAEWRECFRIGALLTVLQIAFSAVVTIGFLLLPGGGLEEIQANLDPQLIGVLTAVLIVTGLIYWVGTAGFIRIGSKSALAKKKG